MSTVTITVASQSEQFPAGTVSSGIVVTLAGHDPVTLTSAPSVATFANVADGEYAITAQAVDASGVALGAAVTGSVTVATAPATVSIDVPASLTVTVS